MIAGSDRRRHTPLLSDSDIFTSINRTAQSLYTIQARMESPRAGKSKEKPLGNDLLSQEVALQVPSALTGLTAGFGM